MNDKSSIMPFASSNPVPIWQEIAWSMPRYLVKEEENWKKDLRPVDKLKHLKILKAWELYHLQARTKEVSRRADEPERIMSLKVFMDFDCKYGISII